MPDLLVAFLERPWLAFPLLFVGWVLVLSLALRVLSAAKGQDARLSRDMAERLEREHRLWPIVEQYHRESVIGWHERRQADWERLPEDAKAVLRGHADVREKRQ